MNTTQNDTSADVSHDTNPYLTARREWNERYGDYIVSAARWRNAFFAATGLAAVSVCATVYLSLQSKIVPYVVEVDKLGRSLFVGQVNTSVPTDPRFVKAFLGEWVTDARSVYADAAAQHRMVRNVYSHVEPGTAAYTVLTEYFKNNDPFSKATNETVTATVEAAYLVAGNTWRVEWIEKTLSRSGTSVDLPKHIEATLTITHKTPSNEKAAFLNPLGLYVTSFNWSEKL